MTSKKRPFAIPQRWSLVTMCVVGAGVAFAALAGLAQLALWYRTAEEVVQPFLQYEWTWCCVVGQFVAIAWLSRQRSALAVPVPRPPGDPTWFVPVFVWGFESLFDVVNRMAGDGRASERAIPSVLMLLFVLGLCMGAERWARHRGCPARAKQASVPLPVLAAILAVQITWTYLRVLETYGRRA